MPFVDKVLKCVTCGAEFVFTAGEQEFFEFKQFANEPRHCKKCKARMTRGRVKALIESDVICSACGTKTTVPFKPVHGRPVLCRACFERHRRKE